MSVVEVQGSQCTFCSFRATRCGGRSLNASATDSCPPPGLGQPSALTIVQAQEHELAGVRNRSHR